MKKVYFHLFFTMLNTCNTRVSDGVFYLGYRMAAECARNALLQKVVDNKEDPGTDYCCILTIFTFYILLPPSTVSLLQELLY